MPLFDSYLMVDWSAAASPKRGRDSIWWASAERTTDGLLNVQTGNPPTRYEAGFRLVELMNDAARRGKRVLAGFDFPFGFPRRSAERLTGEPSWEALWSLLGQRLQDRRDNANNRFAVAAELNERFDGEGPFWGHPHRQPPLASLPRMRPRAGAQHPPQRRHVEEHARGSKPVWQLFGAGSVGSQALLGIAFLERLRRDPALQLRPAIWPFEIGLCAPSDAPIVLAEVYPSLIRLERVDGLAWDCVQVVGLAQHFARLDEDGLLTSAFELPGLSDPQIRGEIVEEEGWILGQAWNGVVTALERRQIGHRLAPPYSYIRDPAEITRRSFEILEAEADLAGLPADIARLARRLIHASGMTDIAAGLAWSEGAVAAGRAALAAGAPIVCDVAMVAAGVAAARLPAQNDIHVAVVEPGAAARAVAEGTTRCAAGMEALAGRLGGTVVAVGNAPTALFRLLELVEEGAPKPALVLGFPVGFVGAAESKAALAANPFGLAFVTLKGRRGGSAMAAAALNALIRDATPDER